MVTQWEKLEKLFGGEKSSLRRLIFLYLYIMGPTHIYQIGKTLSNLGLAKSIRSVIETINRLRKNKFLVEREEVVNNRRRVIVDINWDILLENFINEIQKYEKFTEEEIRKMKEEFHNRFDEVKHLIIELPEPSKEMPPEQLREFLISDLKKVDLFTLISGPLFIIFIEKDKELANKLSKAITRYYVRHLERAKQILELLLKLQPYFEK